MSVSRAFRGAFLVLGLGALVCACAREACQSLSPARASAQQDPELALLANGDREPRPRCAATDSGCGPIPVHDSKRVCYRPSSKRQRLPALPGDEAGRIGPKLACKHDGECNVNGCGNVCTNFRVGSMITDCEGYAWLDQAQFCGCVQGECAFFKQ